MKALLILLLVLAESTSCIAQKDSVGTINAHNTVYLELLGSGFFYTLNYERTFSGPVTLRAGAGYTFLNSGFLSEIFTVPVSVSYLIPISPGSSSHVELGGAATFVWESDQFDIMPGPIIGFRKQNLTEGGSFARIGFTPIFEKEEEIQVYPYGGVSFGVSF